MAGQVIVAERAPKRVHRNIPPATFLVNKSCGDVVASQEREHGRAFIGTWTSIVSEA